MRIARKMACGMALLAASLQAGAADRGFYFGAVGGGAFYDFERIAELYFQDGGWTPVIGPVVGFVQSPTAPVYAAAVGTRVPIPQWQPRDDGESGAAGVMAGYRLMRYAAVEVSYFTLGKLETSRTISAFPILTPVLQFDRQLKIAGPQGSALGILPLSEQWELYVRAGVFFADVDLDVAVNGAASAISAETDSFVWGAGTQYDFGKRWSVRADFQRFNDVGEVRKTGRADIDLLTLGVIFRL